MNVARIMAKHQAHRARVLDQVNVGKRPESPFRTELDRNAPKLDAVKPAAGEPKIHTVQRGENLSVIVKDYLSDQGQPTTVAAVHDAVNTVVNANRISDANLIFPGQKIDLSAISVAKSVEPVATVKHDLPVVAANTPMGGPESPVPVGAVIKAAAMAKPSRSESPWARILGGKGVVSSDFGMRRDPFTGKPAFHKGVDIAAPKGTPIKAFRSGVVTFSGWQRGYGNVVIVRHGDGMESRYAHASKRLVSSGDFVRAGTEIAQVGSTGRSTGNHVHFEVRSDGRAVDPVPHLERERLQVAQVL